MGIIKKQSISGTRYSYFGVIIGFVITGLFFPKILSTDQVGLLRLLVSISVLFAQFSGLGFNAVMIRSFPFFRDKENGHHGFLTLSLIVNTVGFFLSMIVFIIIRPWLISSNIEKSTLFIDYIYYLIPLIFFTSYFNLIDNYFRAIYNAAKGIVYKELWQRVFILISILGYYFNYFEFHFLVVLYTIAICLPTLLIALSLKMHGEFILNWDKGFVNKSMAKEMLSVSFFGIATSFSSILILNLDVVMINHYLGLSDTGVYAIAFYFSALVLIPSKPVIKIATVLIADGWKENNLKKIDEIYNKSNIILSIIALLMFLGLWLNIDNVFEIVGSEYLEGKYVIFFVGLSNVSEMATSVTQYIINNSKYYKVNTALLVLFIIMLIVSNALLISSNGIVGCAVATFFSRIVYNFLSWLFLYRKFGFQPFNLKYILLIFISLISFGIAWIIPQFSNFMIDMIVRSSVFVLLFGTGVLSTKLSPDINETFTGTLRKLKIIK